MARLLKPNGEDSELLPANGSDFTLEELQAAVGGYVQAITLRDGRMLLMDEDGKEKGYAHNEAATQLLRQAGGFMFDHVVGDVLVVTRAEMG